MATNTKTTTTPGTVKGTARVTTTQLAPGMTIRFPGNRRAGRPARTVEITAVRSELRSNGNYSKRARWYIVDLADGTRHEFAPASRHDVTADEHGAPAIVGHEPEPETEQAEPAGQAQEFPIEPAPIVDMNRERILGSLKATGSPEPVRTIAHRARVSAGIAGPILDQLAAEGLAVKVGHYYRRPTRAELDQEPGRTRVILAQDLQPGDVVLTTGPRGYIRRRAIGTVHVDHGRGTVDYEADGQGPWRIPTDWSLTVALPRLIPPA